MTEPKIPRTPAELQALRVISEAKELQPVEKALAMSYMGAAKWVKKVAAELTGVSYRQAKTVFARPHVIKYIDEELRRLGYQTRAVRIETIKETVRVSQGNLIEILKLIMDDDGHFDPREVKRLPIDLSAAVKTFKITEEKRGKDENEYTVRRTEIHMHDKVAALGLLNSMLRISQEDPESEAESPDELKLVGMRIEGPDSKTIDADFEIIDKKKDELVWLKIP